MRRKYKMNLNQRTNAAGRLHEVHAVVDRTLLRKGAQGKLDIQDHRKANLEEELRARQRHDLAVEATKAKVGAVAVEAAVVGDCVDTNAVIEAIHAVGSVGWRGGVAAVGKDG